MRWMLIFLVVESFLWGGGLNSARADIIGFRFSGSWTTVDSDFSGLLTAGHPVAGTIYYDTTIPLKGDNKRAYYHSTTKVINLSFTTDKSPVNIQNARIAIFDDSVKYNNSYSPMSEFQLWFNTSGGPGKEIEPFSLPVKNTMGSFLLKDTRQLLADGHLPCDISSLQKMSTKSFTLSLPTTAIGVQQQAVAKIDSITPVPEPKTIILLCLGLTLISLCQWLNNRKGGLQKLRA